LWLVGREIREIPRIGMFLRLDSGATQCGFHNLK
jgi:hypothetical protein